MLIDELIISIEFSKDLINKLDIYELKAKNEDEDAASDEDKKVSRNEASIVRLSLER